MYLLLAYCGFFTECRVPRTGYFTLLEVERPGVAGLHRIRSWCLAAKRAARRLRMRSGDGPASSRAVRRRRLPHAFVGQNPSKSAGILGVWSCPLEIPAPVRLSDAREMRLSGRPLVQEIEGRGLPVRRLPSPAA